MGNQKQKWTAEEEEALLAGIAKHGTGKWKNILRDPEFNPSLANRSNIDLKDKWRNLSVSGPGSKEKPPKIKAPPAPPNIVAAASAAAAVLVDTAAADAVTYDPPNSLQDAKNASNYNELILEALSTITDSDGADIGTILSYIEKRQELPPNSRRHLGSRLRRLVSQGKLEKVQNNYRISRDTTMGIKPLTLNQKDVRPRSAQAPLLLPSHETIQEAAMAAARRVAEAERKSFEASEAVKEAERVSRMADEADAMRQLTREIYEQCSRGEKIVLA